MGVVSGFLSRPQRSAFSEAAVKLVHPDVELADVLWLGRIVVNREKSVVTVASVVWSGGAGVVEFFENDWTRGHCNEFCLWQLRHGPQMQSHSAYET